MPLSWTLFVLATLISCNAVSVFQTSRNKTLVPTSSRNESTTKIPAPSARIINGFYVVETSYNMPWVVALFQWDQAFCTGSLINNQYILTAAHCLAVKPTDYNGEEICWEPFQYKNQDIQAVIGEADFNNVQNIRNKVHDVNRFWIHGQYKGGISCGNWDFDFAILELKKPVSITPVCLDSGAHKTQNKAIAIGYGSTAPHHNEPMSNHLKGIELYIVRREQCSRDWGFDIGSNKICGTEGYETATYFGATCRGDSGGPLVMYDASYGFIQVGVTSFGVNDEDYMCAGHWPGVFGRVSSVLPFIVSKAGAIKTC